MGKKNIFTWENYFIVVSSILLTLIIILLSIKPAISSSNSNAQPSAQAMPIEEPLDVIADFYQWYNNEYRYYLRDKELPNKKDPDFFSPEKLQWSYEFRQYLSKDLLNRLANKNRSKDNDYFFITNNPTDQCMPYPCLNFRIAEHVVDEKNGRGLLIINQPAEEGVRGNKTKQLNTLLIKLIPEEGHWKIDRIKDTAQLNGQQWAAIKRAFAEPLTEFEQWNKDKGLADAAAEEYRQRKWNSTFADPK